MKNSNNHSKSIPRPQPAPPDNTPRRYRDEYNIQDDPPKKDDDSENEDNDE
jgi:hypothetical protein